MGVNLDDYYARQRGQKKRYEGADVKFISELQPDHKATEKANGVPKFKEVDCISIQWPGGDLTVRMVEEQDKLEYPEKWAAYKAGQEQPLDGTPLSQWPLMPRAIVEELRYYKLYTVEQLRDAHDELRRKLGPLASWIKKAKEWDKAANSTQAQVASLQEQLERLQKQVEHYEHQNSVLIQRIEANEGTRFETPAPRKRKREEEE